MARICRNHSQLPVAALALAVGMLAATSANAQPPASPGKGVSPIFTPAKVPAGSPLNPSVVRVEIENAFNALAFDGKLAAAQTSVDAVLDRLVAYESTRNMAGLVHAAAASRLLRAMAVLNDEDCRIVASHLARSMMLTIDAGLLFRDAPVIADPANTPDTPARPPNEAAQAMRTLAQLIRHNSGAVLQYPALAAAIAATHANPPTHQRARGMTATALIDFYSRNAGKMVIDPRTGSPELLTMVVNSTAPAPELAWAIDRYKGNTNIAARYDEISYDDAALKGNSLPKLASRNYTLPDIRAVGGVCIDQAYFAEHVGKAIGVPTATITGRGSEMGHAWVGFLDTRRKPAEWNFDGGRFGEYRFLRGNTRDPMTGRLMSDARLELTAELYNVPADDRRAALAMLEASNRLGEVERRGLPWPPAATWTQKPPTPRSPTLAARQLLLRDAITRSPGTLAVWDQYLQLAAAGRIVGESRDAWAELILDRVAGTSPGYALELVAPLIAAERDAAEQDRLWDWAYERFYKGVRKRDDQRSDLAAEIRLRQGALRESAGDTRRARMAYQEIIDRFNDDGTSIVAATRALAELLRRTGASENTVIEVYKKSFARVQKPSQAAPEFQMQSNYFRLGMMYAQALERAGDSRQAQTIRRMVTPQAAARDR